MAGRVFAANVVLRDPDTNNPVSFVSGSEVPEWAEKQVDDHVVVPKQKAPPERPSRKD